MSCKFLLSIGLSFVMFCAASQSLYGAGTSTYVYTGKHGVDFSELTAESISIEPLTDSRPDAEANLLLLANGERTKLRESPAALLQSALKQAFIAGKAPMSEDGELKMRGDIIELVANPSDTAMEVSLKVKLKLVSESNKTLWQSTVLGRASAPLEQGIEAALHKAVDNLIENLMFDDYFLMELVP